jgi:epoxyqueuosine reductase QueG
MKEPIRQRAMEQGFDDCRFVRADPPAAAKQFQNWVAEGKFGEMSWIERNAEKRIAPQKVLPDARTAICLAASYDARGKTHEVTVSPKGIVARYARARCGTWIPGRYWSVILPSARGLVSSASTPT